jgi:peptide chain release factor 1
MQSQLVTTLEELATDPDEELRSLALSDLPLASTTLASLRSTLLSVLLPPSSASSLSALIEVKSGVGGSESSLFAAELVRMYMKLAARKGWKADLVETVGLAGVGMGTSEAYREAILEVKGEGAFGMLRREAGVHRVQRVPATESQGRVHTSTVGIIVLPSSEGGETASTDDLFEQKDVKVEVMRSRGAGGQVSDISN